MDPVHLDLTKDRLDLRLTEQQHELIERVEHVASEKISPRADFYDKNALFPSDDIKDIHEEGWLLACLERDYGGLGFGLFQTDPLSFYLIIEHLAKVNPSTAHCFQVHNNTLQQITFFANEEQREKYIGPSRENGALLVGAGSEPPITPKDGSEAIDRVFRTVLKPIDGGFLLNGQKHYVTNLPGAEWILVAAGLDAKDAVVMLHKDTPGLQVDNSFWDPVGMRACVSPIIYFEDCFIPKEDLLCGPGEYVRSNWLARINLGFTANYLGALEGMYDWLLIYVRERGRGADAFRQMAVGELRSQIHAVKLLFYHAISIFKADENYSLRLGHEAKWLAIDTLQKFINLGSQVGGSTSLFNKYPLQRMFRDMQVHSLHSRHHVIAQTIGQAELGQSYNLNRAV